MSNLKIFNLPNIITMLRVSLIPILVIVYYSQFSYHYILAALIFALASMTDWLDGFLARKLGQETKFGAFFDPLADKLIVIIALMLLITRYNSLWIIIPSIIIVSREIVISGLREWMAQAGVASKVTVVYLAKVKTAAQMLAIFILLCLASHSYPELVSIGIFLLFTASVLTVWSMFLYLSNAWGNIT